ncbi:MULTISPECIES: hypothetical protein [unclassified Ensifer]
MAEVIVDGRDRATACDTDNFRASPAQDDRAMIQVAFDQKQSAIDRDPVL